MFEFLEVDLEVLSARILLGLSDSRGILPTKMKIHPGIPLWSFDTLRPEAMAHLVR
jgi:hypothetical protein